MGVEAEVTRWGILDMQVCVPSSWSDEQVCSFADMQNPAGTEMGWIIRREGDAFLSGDSERSVCEDRKGFVHIMLDC